MAKLVRRHTSNVEIIGSNPIGSNFFSLKENLFQIRKNEEVSTMQITLMISSKKILKRNYSDLHAKSGNNLLFNLVSLFVLVLKLCLWN